MSAVFNTEKRKYVFLALFCILFLALILRISSIFHHLPEFPHVDEKTILRTVSVFKPSDLTHSANFIYPDLIYYILWPIIFIGDRFFSVYLMKLFNFDLVNVHIIIGRFFIILLSMIYINIIYVLGKKLFDIRVALLVALFFALNPLSVSLSSTIRPDMLMSVLVLVSFTFICNIYNSDKLRCSDYVWAGLFIGLATAAKYPAVIGLAPLVVVHFIKTKDKSRLINKNILLALLSIGIAFIVFNPFIILDFKHFFKDISNEFNLSLKVFPYISTISKIGWINYLAGFNGYFGTGIVILSIGGLILALYRHTQKDILVLSFPLIFFMVMGIFNRSPSRYMLPLVPFILLLAAEFLIKLFEVIKKAIISKKLNSGIIVLLILISVWPSFYSIIYYNKWVSQKDTRSLAKQWIISHIPSGSRILIDGVSQDASFIFGKMEQHPYRLEIIKWEEKIDLSKFFDVGRIDFVVVRELKDRPAYLKPLYDFINKNFLLVKKFKPVIARPKESSIYPEMYHPEIRIYKADY